MPINTEYYYYDVVDDDNDDGYVDSFKKELPIASKFHICLSKLW